MVISDVTDHRHGYQLTFQGKTGQRTVTLITTLGRPWRRCLSDASNSPRVGGASANML